MERRLLLALAGMLTASCAASHDGGAVYEDPAVADIAPPVAVNGAVVIVRRGYIGAAGAGVQSEADLDWVQGTGLAIATSPVVEQVVVSTLAVDAGLHITYITRGHCAVVADIAGKTGYRVLVVDGVAPAAGMPIAGRVPSIVC